MFNIQAIASYLSESGILILVNDICFAKFTKVFPIRILHCSAQLMTGYQSTLSFSAEFFTSHQPAIWLVNYSQMFVLACSYHQQSQYYRYTHFTSGKHTRTSQTICMYSGIAIRSVAITTCYANLYNNLYRCLLLNAQLRD